MQTTESLLAQSESWLGFSTLYRGVWILSTLGDSDFGGTLMVTGADSALTKGTLSRISATEQRTNFIAAYSEGHFIFSALQMGE
jgi:hypothetical protein